MFKPAISSKRVVLVRTGLLGASLLAMPALAQPAAVPQVSHPVVQAVPEKPAGLRLNDALGRLARNPKDVDALAEAGQASLELGDGQAAIGFYQRALELQPGNVRIKTGLAGAHVLSEDPFTAIELFDQAEKTGPIPPERLSDRGLAFDLVGDNQTAQFYYRQALAAAPNDETLRRLAVSQAISRDRKGMDASLAPLLQRQDKAAWRTRAFGLAILGQADEAEAIARQTMPADMATAITAYLRFMPRLTASQQAGAANLGRFPRAAEMGHDDPRLAFYSRSRVQVAAATPAPAPAATKGRRDRDRKKERPKGQDGAVALAPAPAPAPAPVPPPDPVVGRVTTTAPVKLAQTEPAKATRVLPAASVPGSAAAPTPAQPVANAPNAAPRPSPPVAARVAPATAIPTPGFDLAKTVTPAPGPAPAPAPAPKPAPAPTPAPPPPSAPKAQSIDDVFADFTAPSREVEVQEGAVDVRTIRRAPAPAAVAASKEPVGREQAGKAPTGKGADAKPADPKAKDGKGKDGKGKDAKPAVPSQPSRIWVQVATGRDKAALGFDWRKLNKENATVFKGMKPYVTPWGQANRLLTGPFPTAREANAFLAQVKKAGEAGAFVWTSPAGQVVDALPAGK